MFLQQLLQWLGLLAFAALPSARSLTCKVDSKGLKVEFHKVSGANYYEVQIATSPQGPAFAAQSSEGRDGYVHIYEAVKGKTYFVRLRSHSSKNKFRLRNGWSRPGSWFPCKYKVVENVAENITMSLPKGPPFVPGKKAETFNLGLVRTRRIGTFPPGQPFIDYLDEKNAAGYEFESNWVKNGGVIALYCIEILKKTFAKNTVYTYPKTTTEHFHFANYQDCDTHPREPPYNPALDYTCTPRACKLPAAQCTTANWDAKKYVGKGKGAKGTFYSLPAAAECREDEEVGTMRKVGGICTWKRMAHSRFTELKANNLTPAQIEAMFHGMALNPWHCADKKEGEEELGLVDLVVV